MFGAMRGQTRQTWVMKTDDALSPHDVQQLVPIRLALEAALLQVSTAGAYRRGAAIVALDAVVERCANLCASAHGLAVSAKLEDTISRLRNEANLDWKPTILPDVRLLRKARNAAQHDGLEPDRESLPGWSRAVESFVVGLIEAQYGVDIRKVTLSNAITDPEIRRSFELAEEARELGEFSACIGHVDGAYITALRKWRLIRSRRNDPFHRDKVDVAAHKSIAHLETALDAATFVGDAGAAEWFSALRLERGTEIFDDEDAARAIAFVFAWVTGYESTYATWTHDRRLRAAIASRRVRAGATRASIASATTTSLGDALFETRFVLENVPNVDEYDEWSQALRARLPRAAKPRWMVGADGTVRVTRQADEAQLAVDDVEVLAAALLSVEEDILSQRAVTADKASRLEREAQTMRDAAEEFHSAWPHWVQDISGAQDQQFGAIWRLHLDPAVGNLHLAEQQDSPLRDVAAVIRDLDEVDQCWHGPGRGTIGISPSVPAEMLIEILRTADVAVAAALHRKQLVREAQDKMLLEVNASIAATLVRQRAASTG